MECRIGLWIVGIIPLLDSVQDMMRKKVSHSCPFFVCTTVCYWEKRGLEPYLPCKSRGADERKRQISGRRSCQETLLNWNQAPLAIDENWNEDWHYEAFFTCMVAQNFPHAALVWCKKMFSVLSVGFSCLPSQERSSFPRENPGEQEHCGLPPTGVQCCSQGLFPEDNTT